MSRKTVNVTIQQEGRDKGKSFIITEMPADQAERWGMRALTAILAKNPSIPNIDPSAGMAGLVSIGMTALGGLDFEQAEPLLAEMMDCVKIDMGNGIVRALIHGDGADIEEISTRLLLRKEVLKLHVDFFKAASQLTSG